MTLLLLLVIVCVNVVWVKSAPTVTAPWGRVAGKDVVSPSGIVYSAYQGIPFALPPVGERRFARPVAHPRPGEGRVFNATSLGFVCPQPEVELLPTFPAQSEDCLTLNVYAPSSPSNGRRSVMVWIYGGGFFVGTTAAYSPSKLVTEGNVIVVTIGYRIGIFGFLSSGNEVTQGNWGLFDQTLALKWVKDNIAAFGGDPDTITLFGESAGAGSIGFHLLSPYSTGLFKRGVQQSGTPLSSWAINKKPATFFTKLAERTGCLCQSQKGCKDALSWTETLTSMMWSRGGVAMIDGLQQLQQERMLNCLRELPVDKIMEHTVWLQDNGKFDYFDSTPWIPVVDGYIVPRPPEDLLNDPDYLLSNGVLSKDIMIGVNNNEGGYVPDIVVPEDPSAGADTDDDKSDDVFTAFAGFSALDEDMENQALQSEIKYRYPELENDERRLDTLTNVFNFFYVKPLEKGKVNVQGIADTFADIFFTRGAVQMSKALAKAHLRYPQQTQGSLYLYLFNHFPASKAGLPLQGMNHGEDLFYQFDASPLFPQDQFNTDDFAVESTFIAMLTDFAKNGNSNNALGPQLGGSWPEFSLSDESYLSLSAQPRIEKQMYGKRVALWLDLLPSLYNSTRPVAAATSNGQMPSLFGTGGPFGQAS